MPATTGSIPVTMSVQGRNRLTSRGASRETPNRAAVIGRKEIPARSGLKWRISWTNWVRKKNMPNIPATRSSRVR